MSGAWRLLLGAVIALVVGVTLAAEVHRWIIRSGTTVAAGVLLDRYQGGLGLAVERVLGVVYHHGRSLSRAAQAFLEVLQESADV